MKVFDKIFMCLNHIDISKKVKNGITGTYVDVILEHEHHHKKQKVKFIINLLMKYTFMKWEQ